MMPTKRTPPAQLQREIDETLSKRSGPQTELTYRGWRITPFKGTAMGYQLPESRNLSAQLGFGTHRKFKGYEVHYPEGGVKIVKTIKAARAYIDDYLGPEAL